jgi:hypothetical protein
MERIGGLIANLFYMMQLFREGRTVMISSFNYHMLQALIGITVIVSTVVLLISQVVIFIFG